MVAVIDIGSRAMRMVVGELRTGGAVRRLESLSVPVAIGLDTFARGRIRAVTTETVLRTLKDFLPVLRSYDLQPDDCRVVATTAVRDARNREVFIERIERGTGLRIEVLEAIEETRLVHQLVRHLLGPELDHDTHMLLALGAGGTHVVVLREGSIVLAETRRTGLMRLGRYGGSGPDTIGGARSVLRKSVSTVTRLYDLTAVHSLVVISTELYRLIEGLGRSRPRSGGLELTRRDLAAFLRVVDKASTDAIVEGTRLDNATVGLARLALEALRVYRELTPALKRVIVPDSSMLDSLLLDTRLRLEGDAQHRAEGGAAHVESAAWALARKYRVDEPHAAKVRELAEQLFEQLRPFTTLAERSRLLLRVAAILHEIGLFVAAGRHEQHAEYLIRASPIMGLTHSEVDRVALLARMHRKPVPLTDSAELQRLPPSQRVEVLKLAALLRVADALDADNRQRVARVEVQMAPDALQVRAMTRAGGRDEFAVIQRAFAAKSDLCEELFGVQPRLTEVLAT